MNLQQEKFETLVVYIIFLKKIINNIISLKLFHKKFKITPKIPPATPKLKTKTRSAFS